MQARGIVGYSERMAANLWSSDELRSGVKENLRSRRQHNISEALHEEQVKAAALLKQANVMAKKSREDAKKRKIEAGKKGPILTAVVKGGPSH